MRHYVTCPLESQNITTSIIITNGSTTGVRFRRNNKEAPLCAEMQKLTGILAHAIALSEVGFATSFSTIVSALLDFPALIIHTHAD